MPNGQPNNRRRAATLCLASVLIAVLLFTLAALVWDPDVTPLGGSAVRSNLFGDADLREFVRLAVLADVKHGAPRIAAARDAWRRARLSLNLSADAAAVHDVFHAQRSVATAPLVCTGHSGWPSNAARCTAAKPAASVEPAALRPLRKPLEGACAAPVGWALKDKPRDPSVPSDDVASATAAAMDARDACDVSGGAACPAKGSGSEEPWHERFMRRTRFLLNEHRPFIHHGSCPAGSAPDGDGAAMRVVRKQMSQRKPFAELVELENVCFSPGGGMSAWRPPEGDPRWLSDMVTSDCPVQGPLGLSVRPRRTPPRCIVNQTVLLRPLTTYSENIAHVLFRTAGAAKVAAEVGADVAAFIVPAAVPHFGSPASFRGGADRVHYQALGLPWFSVHDGRYVREGFQRPVMPDWGRPACWAPAWPRNLVPEWDAVRRRGGWDAVRRQGGLGTEGGDPWQSDDEDVCFKRVVVGMADVRYHLEVPSESFAEPSTRAALHEFGGRNMRRCYPGAFDGVPEKQRAIAKAVSDAAAVTGAVPPPVTHRDVTAPSAGESPARPVVTVVQRVDSRRLLNLDALVAAAACDFPQAIFRVVDLASLPPEQQVATAAESDALVGVHGAAFSWMVAMRPGTGAAEIRYPGKAHGMTTGPSLPPYRSGSAVLAAAVGVRLSVLVVGPEQTRSEGTDARGLDLVITPLQFVTLVAAALRRPAVALPPAAAFLDPELRGLADEAVRTATACPETGGCH